MRTPTEAISAETVAALVRVFERQAGLEQILDDIREKLRPCLPHKLFEEIDYMNSLFIGTENLTLFVSAETEFELDSRGVDAVLRRFDRDGDGRLSFVEFLPAILPFGPGQICAVYSVPAAATTIVAGGTSRRKEFATPDKKMLKQSSMLQKSAATATPSAEIVSSNTISLREVLRRQIAEDRRVEERKRRLWARPDFSLGGLMAMLGAKREDHVEIKLVAELVDEPHQEKLSQLLVQHDSDGDGLLAAKELGGILCPHSGDDKESDLPLGGETNGMLRELLTGLVERETELENTRRELKIRGFNAINAFEECAGAKAAAVELNDVSPGATSS